MVEIFIKFILVIFLRTLSQHLCRALKDPIRHWFLYNCLKMWYLNRWCKWCIHLLLPNVENIQRIYRDSYKNICINLDIDLCGFYIALLAATARILGLEEDFRDKFGKYCNDTRLEGLAGRYAMCRSIGIGYVRKLRRKLLKISREAGGDDREHAELALGIRKIYNVAAAYCVPYAEVEKSIVYAKEWTYIVEICKGLREAIYTAITTGKQ